MTNEIQNTMQDSEISVNDKAFAQESNDLSLRQHIEHSMRHYFDHLDGQDAKDVYELVMSEIEAPLLEVVMAYTKDNQTRASEVLGLNRGTLRKKLKRYDLL
ncbi:MAG: DNA-binding transcriptional regulator Fis [Pontibacterium sp.]